MLNYGFFDYKHNISGFESDLFKTEHIVFIIAVYIITFALSCFLRNTGRERITTALKVLSIAMVIHEVTKIAWESYYDITTGQGFNWGGLLPIYTCSLFIYTLLGAAWGRGKTKEYCLAFITTVGLLYGAVGVIYCNGLNFYPFWTFGAFYSLFFHMTMFFTGVFLLIAGYKELEWKDALRAFVPILLLALAAIPVNYYLNVKCGSNADYMLIYSGSGVPIYEDIAAKLGEKGLRAIYTALMMITHIPLAALIIAAYKGIAALVKKQG